MANNKERPKVTISKTKSEWVWDVIGYTCYLGSIIFLIYNWSILPDKVPAHYNALGEVDRWGSKKELFVLPIIGIFIAVLMQWIEKHPEKHNYPERLNNKNARAFYLLSRKTSNQLKNICLIIFSLGLFESISIALNQGNGFGVWFLPLLLVSVTFPIIFGLIKQIKIK